MLQEAYKAVLAVCNALVPGNGLELMDALMETTDVYRKRYGYKKNLFDLEAEEDEIVSACLPVSPCTPCVA
jgi:hypothetical protein